MSAVSPTLASVNPLLLLPDGREILSTGRLRAIASCERLERNRYQLGIRHTETSAALDFGTLFHRLLELWWGSWKIGGTMGAAFTEDVPLAIALEELDRSTHAGVYAAVLLEAYDARWREELASGRVRVVGVEQLFVADVVNPETGRASRGFAIASKLDVVAEHEDQGLVVFEHKTTSKDVGDASAYWRSLPIDPQVSAYYLGAEVLGFGAVAGCFYDVIRKPGLSPLRATPIEERTYTKAAAKEPSRLYKGQRETDETPEEYGERLRLAIAEDPDRFLRWRFVPRLAHQLDEFRADVWERAERIRLARRRLSWPRNPAACVPFGRPCEFVDSCGLGLDPLSLPTVRQVADPFPELAELPRHE